MKAGSDSLSALLMALVVFWAATPAVIAADAAQGMADRRAKYEARLQTLLQLYDAQCNQPGRPAPPAPGPAPGNGGIPNDCDQLKVAIAKQEGVIQSLDQAIQKRQQQLAQMQEKLKYNESLAARIAQADGNLDTAANDVRAIMAKAVSDNDKTKLRQLATDLSNFKPRTVFTIKQEIGQLKKDIAKARADRTKAVTQLKRLKAALQNKINRGECGGPPIIQPPDPQKPAGPFTDSDDPNKYDCDELLEMIAALETEIAERQATIGKLEMDSAELRREMTIFIDASQDQTLVAKDRARFQASWAIHKKRLRKNEEKATILRDQVRHIRRNLTRLQNALVNCQAAHPHPDSASVFIGMHESLDVLQNDRMPQDPMLDVHVVDVSAPSLGTAKISLDGRTLMYHAGNRPGVDQFTYSLVYTHRLTNEIVPAPARTLPGRVTINVIGADDGPPLIPDGGNSQIVLKRVTRNDGFNFFAQQDIITITDPISPSDSDDTGDTGGDNTSFGGLFSGPTTVSWPTESRGTLRSIVFEKKNGVFTLGTLNGPDFDVAVFFENTTGDDDFRMIPGGDWHLFSIIPLGFMLFSDNPHTVVLVTNAGDCTVIASFKVTETEVTLVSLFPETPPR